MSEKQTLTGTSRLADVISSRIHEETSAPLLLDFGEIWGNRSLRTNTFPVPIKKGDYSICRPLIDGNIRLEPGMRVLVAWVQSEAVVVGVIQRS